MVVLNKTVPYNSLKPKAANFFSSVAETKLFIFGSGSDFVHNFGSSSSYSHILPHKTVR